MIAAVLHPDKGAGMAAGFRAGEAAATGDAEDEGVPKD